MSNHQPLEPGSPTGMRTSSVCSKGSTISDVESYEKPLLRRIDLRLLPLLAMVYSFALVDRSNLGVARVVGMGDDLGLAIGNRFSIASLVFFIPYAILQLPSNLMLRQVGPRLWMSLCVLGWGAVQLSMGFVTNWRHLTLCRVLLGTCEAGYFPAMALLITTWYKRHEVQKRLGAFYLTSLLAGGWGSILGYAISLLDGKRGLAGWRWIFIIEGTVTLFLGVLTYLCVPGFPHQNRFLSETETEYILKRVNADRGDAIPDQMTTQIFLMHLRDWRLWAYGLMFMCATMASSAVGYFITLILNGMGFSTTQSLLLTAPPYAFTAISIFFFSWISDRTKHRASFIAAQALLTTLGLLMTMYIHAPSWRYVGLYLSTAGASGNVPSILAYAANNVVSHTKRTVSTALIISFGGAGGVFATAVFRQQDYPNYLPGMWATVGCQLFMLCLLTIMTWSLHRQNILLKKNPLRKPLEHQEGFFYTL